MSFISVLNCANNRTLFDSQIIHNIFLPIATRAIQPVVNLIHYMKEIYMMRKKTSQIGRTSALSIVIVALVFGFLGVYRFSLKVFPERQLGHFSSRWPQTRY